MHSKKLRLAASVLAVLFLVQICMCAYVPKTAAQTTSWQYTFNGFLDEITLAGVNVPANVTVVYPAGSGVPTSSFLTPGGTANYVLTTSTQPLYFLFDLTKYYGYNVTRQYWLAPFENNTVLSCYTVLPNLVAINFVIRALGGVGSGLVIRATLLNQEGSQGVVEQRLVDDTNSAMMNLRPDGVYAISVLYQDGTWFNYGNIAITSSVITLTISPMTFTETVINHYQYVRFQATQPFYDEIRIDYQDTFGGTVSVAYTIRDQQDRVMVDQEWDGLNSFSDIWTGIVPGEIYVVDAVVEHSVFGTLTFSYILGEINTGFAAVIDVGVLGYFGGIPTTEIIAVIIILVVFGLFSAVNSYIGIFAGLGTAGVLYWIGWFNVGSSGLFVAGFAVLILLAITYWKRRGG